MASFAASTSSSAEPEKMVRLTSMDNESYEIPLSVAKMSNLVTGMITEDDSEDIPDVPLPNVDSKILAKVIEYCKHHQTERMRDFEKPLQKENLAELVQEYYANYIDVDQDTLFNLTLAANYMDIQPLLDLCSAKIASFIKGKTPEQIRTNLGIVNDFTPEEEAQLREETKWADEL